MLRTTETVSVSRWRYSHPLDGEDPPPSQPTIPSQGSRSQSSVEDKTRIPWSWLTHDSQETLSDTGRYFSETPRKTESHGPQPRSGKRP